MFEEYEPVLHLSVQTERDICVDSVYCVQRTYERERSTNQFSGKQKCCEFSASHPKFCLGRKNIIPVCGAGGWLPFTSMHYKLSS